MATERCGSWPSPITPAMAAAGQVGVGSPQLAGGVVWWDERRPAEGGRVALMRRRSTGETEEVLASPWSVRTRVHEYGGGAWRVDGRTVYFVNDDDQRLYRLDELDEPGEPGDPRKPGIPGSPGTPGRPGEPMAAGRPPIPLTPEPPARHAERYADLRPWPGQPWLIAVQETHSEARVDNRLVAVATDGSLQVKELIAGSDFYSFPRPSPDGRRLAWTTWDHPLMPWDGTQLWTADLVAGRHGPELGTPRLVAGGSEESIFQPEWSPSGGLHFVSDRTGWWNLYAETAEETGGGAGALAPMEAEFGAAQWSFDMARYAFLADGTIACIWKTRGQDHLGLIDPGGQRRNLEVPFTSLREIRAEGSCVVLVAGAPAEAPAVVRLDLTSGHGEHPPPDRVQTPADPDLDPDLDPEWIAHPEPIVFATTGGRTAYGLYYPPTHPDRAVPPGERPPLLVTSHGGPTAGVEPVFDLRVQFWTTRGFGLVDVAYGGSTGYGRAFRNQLRGAWGIVDVDDCVAAARHLAADGAVDGNRLIIRGRSAGGYTTLCALAFRTDFAAGASYYGVADPTALARDTHKFEARYLDGLIGPWPDAADTYRDRSPAVHPDGISCPVILFQGLEDPIVPPSQAEAMVSALAAKGIPHAYLTFPGEQHGFRRASSMERCLEAELSFYGQIFGFEPDGITDPVAVTGL